MGNCGVEIEEGREGERVGGRGRERERGSLKVYD